MHNYCCVVVAAAVAAAVVVVWSRSSCPSLFSSSLFRSLFLSCVFSASTHFSEPVLMSVTKLDSQLLLPPSQTEQCKGRVNIYDTWTSTWRCLLPFCGTESAVDMRHFLTMYLSIFHNSCSIDHCLNHLYTANRKPAGSMQLRHRGHNFALPTVHLEFNKRHFVARVLFDYVWCVSHVCFKILS